MLSRCPYAAVKSSTTALKTSMDGSGVYVIMLTGLGEKTEVEKGQGAGADQYLVKPVRPSMLWEIITRLGCLVV